MAKYNFSYPDIPHMEDRSMYDYYSMMDKLLRDLGTAINSINPVIDLSNITNLAMPKADGLTIRVGDNNVWSVILAPRAIVSAIAEQAEQADKAVISDTTNKLNTARAIELTGDVTGTAMFDGSTDITIPTTITVQVPEPEPEVPISG